MRVAVFVVQTTPNYAQPWQVSATLMMLCLSVPLIYRKEPNEHGMPLQMRPQRSSAGSAFIMDTSRREIMTNAHVVSFPSVFVCTETVADKLGHSVTEAFCSLQVAGNRKTITMSD